MKIIYKPKVDNIPAKIWADYDKLEYNAKEQINNLQNLPFSFKHVAIMPDCHSGYGMPIGGVLATKGVVIPNAVGVDIGCGMCAVKTSLKAEQLDKETLKKIMGRIREVIPVGFNHHKEKQNLNLMPLISKNIYETERWYLDKYVIKNEFENARKQIGTLGGGNHFIEIQKDTKNNIWIMIHSGSRNLGKKIADYYNKLAVELNDKWYSEVPKKWELAFLPIETQEAKDYLNEMQYCVDFALANRKLMMERICYILTDVCSGLFTPTEDEPFGRVFFKMNDIINIAHNYAQMENHFGENVMVHRKGATLAREGTIGIIPGSQGSKSYIVAGLGNKDSFESCSHGAGRKMSRSKACAELKLEEEIAKLDNQGIVHGIRNVSDLDEASGAYKDIDEVMENQKDLVKILVELQPIAVIKG